MTLRQVSNGLRLAYPDPISMLNSVLKPIFEEKDVCYDKFMEALRISGGFLVSVNCLRKIICFGVQDYNTIATCIPHPDNYPDLLQNKLDPSYIIDRYGLHEYDGLCDVLVRSDCIRANYAFWHKKSGYENSVITIEGISLPSFDAYKTAQERKYACIRNYYGIHDKNTPIIIFDGKQLFISGMDKLRKRELDLNVEVCNSCTEDSYKISLNLRKIGFVGTVSS